MAATLPLYIEISDSMQRSESEMRVSEAHGVLCGLVCASGHADQARWIHRVMGDCDTANTAVQESIRLLSVMHEVTLEQIYDPIVEFQLYLPDDEEPMRWRADEFSRWCQGFVFGLADGGLNKNTELPGDTSELMRDIVEFSRASHDEEDVSEADEESYMQLVEYVRVGVLLINEELQPMKAQGSVH